MVREGEAGAGMRSGGVGDGPGWSLSQSFFDLDHHRFGSQVLAALVPSQTRLTLPENDVLGPLPSYTRHLLCPRDSALDA